MVLGSCPEARQDAGVLLANVYLATGSLETVEDMGGVWEGAFGMGASGKGLVLV